jgi:histone-lysine N-methyltransferase SETMAR
LQSFRWEVLAPPPQSPDLAPSDNHLFPKLKESLAGKSFSDNDEVQDVVMTWLTELGEISMTLGIKIFIPRLSKCIAIHGDYATSKSKYFLDFVSLLSK